MVVFSSLFGLSVELCACAVVYKIVS